MTTNDEIHDEVCEEKTTLTSLEMSLTESRKPPSHKDTLTLINNCPKDDTPYVSHSETDLLSCDEVGRSLMRTDMPLGIDWMALSFTVRDVYAEVPGQWRETISNGNRKHQWETNFELYEGSVFLQVTQSTTGLWGYVQFNPSTICNGPNGVRPIFLNKAIDVLYEVMDLVKHWVHVATPIEEMTMSRLDINKTIGPVADIQRILSIVSDYPYNHRVKTQTIKSRRAIETVSCRSKASGGFIVYDKGLQAKLSEPVIRFEVNARRRVLKKKCGKVKDLSQERCEVLFNYYLGDAIKAMQSVPRTMIDDIVAIDKDRKVLIELIGVAHLKDKGHFCPINDYAWRLKYKPFMTKYGLSKVADLL
jgi:hypothetical protein